MIAALVAFALATFAFATFACWALCRIASQGDRQ